MAKNYDATPGMEQIGVEPQRSPVSDVIFHLVHKGHDDPRVAKFGQTYLANLERFLNKPAEAHGPRYAAYYKCFDGQIELPEKHVEVAREWLNETLYQAMMEKRSDLHIQSLSLYILVVSQGDGREYILSNWVKKDLGVFKDFRSGVERFGTPSFTTPAVSQDYLNQIRKGWRKKHIWMAEAWVAMIKELRYCMEVLAKEDPLLSDTGKYIPQYRQRTYIDQEKLVANELTTLPNYTAKVRLLTEEHTLVTPPAPRLLSDAEVASRIQSIKQRMLREGYTKSAAEVEEEVRKRHEALRARPDDDNPPTTHSNERRRPRR